MKVYLVGGAVRDALLGLPVEERDWVVVGADADQMRAAGFLAVDADFPVFRHPETGEEYALARRETKQGPGYRGFAIEAGPDVTLEEDLARRDLTINAIAQAEEGTLVDPFGGREDLQAGLLRHVSPAFVEDPLRVWRVARFAAKLGRYGFRVAHGTHRLMRQVVQGGGMAELHAERVGRETQRAMATDQPWRYFEVLQRCGALAFLVPELARVMGDGERAHAEATDSRPVAALKRISEATPDPKERLLAALWPAVDDPERADRLAERLRLERPLAQALRRVAADADPCRGAAGGDDAALAGLAVRWHRLPVDQRKRLVGACGAQSADPRFGQRIADALRACDAVDIGALRATGLTGAELGAAIDDARHEAVGAALRQTGSEGE